MFIWNIINIDDVFYIFGFKLGDFKYFCIDFNLKFWYGCFVKIFLLCFFYFNN